MSRLLRMGSIALTSLALVAATGGTAFADITPTGGDPETVTGTPMVTYQTNGTVWAMEIVNNVLYVGGNFTAVRPSGAAVGQSETPRSRLAAFNATTGALLPWAPVAASTPFVPAGTPDKNCLLRTDGKVECATVWSLKATPNKKKLVIGGDFQSIDGKLRAGLAAFDVASGALDTTFKPSVSGRIYTVFPTDDVVYAGGSITKAAGQTRSQLAAFDLAGGALRSWAPKVTAGASVGSGLKVVRSLVVTDDRSRVIIAGGFDAVNNTTIHGLAAVDAATGATAAWQDAKIYYRTGLTSLLLKDGIVYTTGDALGSVSEGIIAFNAATGAKVWDDGCRGASHSVAMVRGVIYAGAHAHNCETAVDSFPEQYQGYTTGDRRRYELRAEVPTGDGRARLLHWFPETNDGNGPRAMATDGDRLWIGGEFTLVDNKPQQGITGFAFLGAGGVNHKPLTPRQPIAFSTVPGKAEIIWQATEDPDNRDLEYWVIRDHATKNPIHKVKSSDRPWLKGWMSHTDEAVAPGETHFYDIRAVDPTGTPTSKSTRSPGVSVTIAGVSAAAGSLPKAEGATSYYNFDGKVAGRYTDLVSGRTAVAGSQTGETSAIGPTGKALSLNGNSGSAVVETASAYAPRQLSFEMTFKTTTSRGGVLASLGSSNSTSGLGTANRILYMGNDGRIRFGARPDADRTDPMADPVSSTRVLSTSGSYNNGQWHHLSVTFEPGTGTRIYVDGSLVAEDALLRWSRSANSYLRFGADQTSGWSGAPTSSWFAGTIDDAAYYQYPLTAQQVARHAAGFLAG